MEVAQVIRKHGRLDGARIADGQVVEMLLEVRQIASVRLDRGGSEAGLDAKIREEVTNRSRAGEA
jgi:hypothetical protein